eukprot:358677-Chlamydomonas_euryale.AAC.1
MNWRLSIFTMTDSLRPGARDSEMSSESEEAESRASDVEYERRCAFCIRVRELTTSEDNGSASTK